MNNFQLSLAEETVVETTEDQTIELSLPELEMVGGGGMGSLLM